MKVQSHAMHTARAKKSPHYEVSHRSGKVRPRKRSLVGVRCARGVCVAKALSIFPLFSLSASEISCRFTYSEYLFPSRFMKTPTSLALTLVAGLLLTTVGAVTASADGEDSAATCDQITEIMKKIRPGTLSYQRMKDQYNRKCLEIKSGCPSQVTMDYQTRECTKAGMYASPYIDASSCKQIRCSATPPVSSSSSSSVTASSASSFSRNGPCPAGTELTTAAVACKSKNLKHEYYNFNGCRQVRCIENVTVQTECPSVATMRNKATACKARGEKYETYTVGVCKMVRCLSESLGGDAVVCADDKSINAMGTRCKVRGLNARITADEHGCRKVTCTSFSSSKASGCPSDDDLDKGIIICKKSGLTGTTMVDDNGCRQVICQK